MSMRRSSARLLERARAHGGVGASEPASPVAVAPSPSGARAWLRRGRANPVRQDTLAAATAVGCAALVGGLAAASGGYYPTSWGWTALALLWVALVALVVGQPRRPSALEWAFLAGLGGFTVWIVLSLLWAHAGTPIVELQRMLVYLGAAIAAVALVRRRTVGYAIGGALIGIAAVCGYGVATRVFPERLGTFDAFAQDRLSQPVGYWNAFGILAAVGCLLALGFATRGRSLASRAAGGAAIVVVLEALYFTFSRGAWIALAAGALAAIALDRRRLQLAATTLVLAPVPAVAVLLASRASALTTQGAVLADATREGHRLAIELAALIVGGAGVAVLAGLAQRRWRPSRRVRVAFAGVLIACPVALVAIVLVRWGTPPTLAEKAWDAFKAPPAAQGGSLNDRLFSLANPGRTQQYAVAWQVVEEEPLLGSGAGTYERSWARLRHTAYQVRDAHSLYLETLSELGPVGLALLLAFLVAPLAAATRARASPVVPLVFGAYVAFLVHAGGDWDWEMPAVTLAALLCAVALLVRAHDRERARMGLRTRIAIGAVCVAAIPFALLTALGAAALAESGAAGRDGNWPKAEDEARRAASYWPWSAAPLAAEGYAQLVQRETAEARATFRAAVAKDAGDWKLWFDLARASDGVERAQAIARASALNPLGAEIASLGPVVVTAHVERAEAEK